MRHAAVFLVLGLAAAGGCAAPPRQSSTEALACPPPRGISRLTRRASVPGDPPRARLVVEVRDGLDTSHVIEHMALRLVGDSGTYVADASVHHRGTYVFLAVPAARYSLRATRISYVAQTWPVELRSGSVDSLTALLPQAYPCRND